MPKTTMVKPAVDWGLITQALQIPAERWILGDNLCDCVFQRIGEWANPYIGRTLRIRLCCIWAELAKMFPQFVQDIPAYYDENRDEWITEPQPWNSEDMDMPIYLWHRQEAQRTGKDIAVVRAELRGRERERPKRVKLGTGWQSQPTPRQLKAAKEARLRASGWII